MTKLATEPVKDVGDDAERTVAAVIALDSLPQLGATFFGVGVRSVRIELADGRVQRLELPGFGMDDEPDQALTPKQSAILTVIDEMGIGEVLGYEAIAKRTGYAATNDMRDFIRQLATAGRLAKDRMGWKRLK